MKPLERCERLVELFDGEAAERALDFTYQAMQGFDERRQVERLEPQPPPDRVIGVKRRDHRTMQLDGDALRIDERAHGLVLQPSPFVLVPALLGERRAPRLQRIDDLSEPATLRARPFLCPPHSLSLHNSLLRWKRSRRLRSTNVSIAGACGHARWGGVRLDETSSEIL